LSNPRPTDPFATRAKRANQFAAYKRQHRIYFKESLLRQWANKRAALATWLVISVAVALPTLLGVIDTQLRQVVDNFELRGSITLFLDESYAEQQPDDMIDSINTYEGVVSARYISAAEGLRALEEALDQPDLSVGLDSNPLPAAIVVGLDEQLTRQQWTQLADSLSLDSRVTEVALDADWLSTLKQWVQLIRVFSVALGVLLLTGAALTLTNSIRALVESRQQELEVVALLGGTAAFNSRPFLYSGFWYGLIGGLLAILWVQIILAMIAQPLAALIAHYGASTNLIAISLETSVWLVLATAMAGVLAAKLAVAPKLQALLPGPAPIKG